MKALLYLLQSVYVMISGELAEKIALLLDEDVDMETRDDILYQVLTDALRSRLKRMFRPFEQYVPFTFEDALQDYFLYLRGDDREPYSALRCLKDTYSIDSWMLSTFRNFLGKTARSSVQTVLFEKPDIFSDASRESALEMQNITLLSTMIAYCYQELPKVQRFVFLRMMLTYLDKSKALPQNDVAKVLGMSHVYYRVLNNRVRSSMDRVKRRLMGGEHLHLGLNALYMQKALSADFSGWYDLLSGYYEETIAAFDQSEDIDALRYRYFADSPGLVLHDVHTQIIYGCQ